MLTDKQLKKVRLYSEAGGWHAELIIGGPNETVKNVLPFETREAALEWAERRLRQLKIVKG
jgi:hypothetical protein